jgi:PHS family inorganic phosphate transporter-like MFS transporter
MEHLPEPAIPSSYTTRTYGGNAAFHNFHNDYSHIQDPNLRRRLALSEVSRHPSVGQIAIVRIELTVFL